MDQGVPPELIRAFSSAWHLSACPFVIAEYAAKNPQPAPTVIIEAAIFSKPGFHTPPATPCNCSADISSDDSATDFKYSSAVKGVPALSDNLASFSAVDLAASA